MNNRIKTIFTLLLVSFAFLQINAQQFGYINSQEIISLMPEVQEANSNLETYSTQLQKRAEQMYKALETKAATLQQKKESGDISPKQMEVELATLQQEEQKLAEFQSQSQGQIQNKQAELLQPILEKVQKAIDEVADEKGYQMVFDASQGVILYADDNTDISAQVKAKLGL